MWVQLVVIFLATIIYILYRLRPDYNSNMSRKWYIITVCMVLVLQSGLRSYSVGEDTYTYFVQFEHTKKMLWSEIFQGFTNVYLVGEGKDPGYPLFVKIFQIISNNYSVYLLFVASIFFCAFGTFIYKNSYKTKDILIIVILYQALFYEFFSITGTRQVIAVAFTLFGFHYIKERKFFKFMLLMLPAVTIHLSSLIFVPFYFVANIKSPRLCIIGALGAFPLLVQFANDMATILVSALGSNIYLAYVQSSFQTDGARGFALFFILFVILTLLFYRGIKRDVPESYFSFNALSLALIFTPLTWVDPSFMRVVQYFSIFMLLVLPYLLNHSSKNYLVRLILYLLCMLFLITYIIIGEEEYEFVWQTF